MKSSPMMQNRTKRWIERLMLVSLLLFIFGALSVYRESLHQRLSEDLRQEQIRSKELINEGSNLEWRLAEHASTAVIKKNAQLELGMVPNGQSADEIFVASAIEYPVFGIMGFFRISGNN